MILRVKLYITVLIFTLATFFQFAEINTFCLGQRALNSSAPQSSSVEKKKNSSKAKLDFNATLHRETLTNKRSNPNLKIGFFIKTQKVLLNRFHEKIGSKVISDEVLRLTDYVRPVLSRSPPFFS